MNLSGIGVTIKQSPACIKKFDKITENKIKVI